MYHEEFLCSNFSSVNILLIEHLYYVSDFNSYNNTYDVLFLCFLRKSRESEFTAG